MKQNRSDVNLERSERAVSILAGFTAVAVGSSGNLLRRAVLVSAGLEMIRRGFTGHCLFYGELNRRSRLRIQDQKVDEMLEQSFPASDPTASY